MTGNPKLRLYLADQADKVLSIYEDANPGDTRVREAIAAARAFAYGEIDVVALKAAHETVNRTKLFRGRKWRNAAGHSDYSIMSQSAAAHVAWKATQPLMTTPTDVGVWVGQALEWAGEAREAA